MNPSDSLTSAVDDPPLKKGTILLVDDDRAVLRYLEVALRRAGHTVLTAADGLEAMKIALASRIDAVITDAVMPHLSGHELCRFLRRQPQFTRLPILVLSGLEQSETPPDAAERADVYLDKPIRPEELISCLAQLLARAT